jgi:hypothetical protein
MQLSHLAERSGDDRQQAVGVHSGLPLAAAPVDVLAGVVAAGDVVLRVAEPTTVADHLADECRASGIQSGPAQALAVDRSGQAAFTEQPSRPPTAETVHRSGPAGPRRRLIGRTRNQ